MKKGTKERENERELNFTYCKLITEADVSNLNTKEADAERLKAWGQPGTYYESPS